MNGTDEAAAERKDMAAQDWPPNIQAVFKRMAPASRYLGLEIIAADQTARTVEVAFNAGPELCNMWGGIQGGMVAAMLDDVMSLAVGLDLEWGQISPTLELKVSMLNAARPGRIIGRGRVIKRGRSVGFIEGELLTEDGTLLATGSSTATFVTLKKKEKSAEA
ncbi:PaaI family thioesterase [Parvibaculum sp.]|uniref:PaaI family thioesterase n=1 Tax=Parvibaculum sp. TaxID=2024848 RepID=UPI002CE96B19|nr:PaaI family thioesterase [Parvibaculum sp.]HUD53310.1 PaaI family thioesterase [Parvibaculum sp.]